MDVKAKKLRRDGFVTGNLFGKAIEGSIPLKMDRFEVERLLKTDHKGSQIMLNVEGQDYDVLIKEVDYNAMKRCVDEIDFQALVSTEKVHSTAAVQIENREKVLEGALQECLEEIEYKALPAALTDVLAVGSLVIFGQTFGVNSKDISTAATMLLAIVGFMILFKISAPMNKLRVGILMGCIAGLLFCSVYLHRLFAITGMSVKCIMLFVVFSIATESAFRFLTILVDKTRFYYLRLRGKATE